MYCQEIINKKLKKLETFISWISTHKTITETEDGMLTGPVFKTLCSSECQTSDKVQKPRNSKKIF
jgi:hypothetical protein